jgi:hypothetical protein
MCSGVGEIGIGQRLAGSPDGEHHMLAGAFAASGAHVDGDDRIRPRADAVALHQWTDPVCRVRYPYSRSLQQSFRKCMSVRLTGAMSMRQNDFGGAPSATNIAARITAGWVTANVGNALLVNDSSHPDTRSIRSTIDSPPCGAWPGSLSQTFRSAGGRLCSVSPHHRPQYRSANFGSVVACRPSNFAVCRARRSGPVSWLASLLISRRCACRRPVSLSGSSAGNRPADIASVIACDTNVSRTTSVTPRCSMPVRSRLAPRAAAPRASQRRCQWSPTAPAA